jgi:hypothetical protein
MSSKTLNRFLKENDRRYAGEVNLKKGFSRGKLIG